MRSMKANSKEAPIPRRKSLGANQVLNAKDGKEKTLNGIASLPRKFIKTVRRSLAPNDIPSFKAAMEELKADEEKEENLNNNNKDEIVKSMGFARMRNEKVSEYWEIHDEINLTMSSIGGMIKLHQYCHQQYINFEDAHFRDGANFFRNADIGCIHFGNLVPIRMVDLKMLDCETVEPWFRDYYSRRTIDEKKVHDEYREDIYTEFDSLFDEIGNDVFHMMDEQIKRILNYCISRYHSTYMDVYKKGEVFWRRVTPFHLPRNYQLALILCKKHKWSLAEVEEWFRFFYDKDSWRGARKNDVYETNV
uniref:Uncharacterized protein n=1 Tax=Caenorhabditis tropicalis TaxID=1561998 RepID=A0A1I7TJ63_9PELO